MVVVVAEHRHDRRVDHPTGVGEDHRLLHQAVRRQVAGEQDQMGIPADAGEGPRETLPVFLGRMEVAHGCDGQVVHGQGVPGR